MSLKIIGGEFGGRNLQSVKGLGTRPLLGQVREALFNILGSWIEGKEVWDDGFSFSVARLETSKYVCSAKCQKCQKGFWHFWHCVE